MRSTNSTCCYQGQLAKQGLHVAHGAVPAWAKRTEVVHQHLWAIQFAGYDVQAELCLGLLEWLKAGRSPLEGAARFL